MTVYDNQTSWNEFSLYIDDLIRSGKPTLTNFIDYYLKEGGTYSELQTRIKEKTVELGHRGYSFTNDMLHENGTPKQRSFLGHIASRVIDKDWTVKIGEKSIDRKFLTHLTKNQIALENQALKDLCKQDVYIRIEAICGEKRTDPLSNSRSEPITGKIHYLPTKEDCEQAIRQLHDEGRQSMTEQVLDRIEKNVKTKGIALKPNWRMITEENMKIWSRGWYHV